MFCAVLVSFESSVNSGTVPEKINQTCCIECPPQWHLFSFIEYFVSRGIRQSALKTTEGFLSQESQVGSKVTLAEKLIIHLFPVLFCWLLLLVAVQSHSSSQFCSIEIIIYAALATVNSLLASKTSPRPTCHKAFASLRMTAMTALFLARGSTLL